MSSNEDILITEIESWRRFEYALREDNSDLFHKILEKCQNHEYFECANAKGDKSIFVAFMLAFFPYEARATSVSDYQAGHDDGYADRPRQSRHLCHRGRLWESKHAVLQWVFGRL